MTETTIYNIGVVFFRVALIGGIFLNISLWSMIFGRWLSKKRKQYRKECGRMQQESRDKVVLKEDLQNV